jgi:molybdenum-dependent DNA-binding transcriptional regulator ModE
MDKLNAMQTFVRVAELGSLSAAARDMGLTQPAVSQQIAGLEQQLRAQLLFRSTRAVTLTDAGAGYYRQWVKRKKYYMAKTCGCKGRYASMHQQVSANNT